VSTAKHPQSDGQTEKMNSVLEDTPRHFVGPYQADWNEYLAMAELAINIAWNQSIDNTAFMLNCGQKPDTPEVVAIRSVNPAFNKFVGKWSRQLNRAKRCIEAAQDRQKSQADKARRPVPEFTPGDEVLIQTTHFKLHQGLKPKLAPRFLGPFKVLENNGPANLAYRVELPKSMSRVHAVFTVSPLKPNHRSGNCQPLLDMIVDEPEWEVDFIADIRGNGWHRRYKVYWVGYGDDWLPVCTLSHCPEKLKAFREYNCEPCPHTI
jgi:hypothetical protein